MVLRRFHLAKLLAAKDFTGIRADLKQYKLGWKLDNSINDNVLSDDKSLELVLNKVGAYADKIVLWGDGSVYRELMSSDDLADACLYLMRNKDFKDIGEFVNITRGDDIQLSELFTMMKRITGFKGTLEYDTSKPSGTPRKMMDATRIKKLGWDAKIPLEKGIQDFYTWYIQQVKTAK